MTAAPATVPSSPLPTVHLARDHAPAVVAARVRSGRWTRARPGAYVEEVAELDPYAAARRMALARIVALRRQLSVDYIVSHQSAALLWGLPLLSLPDRTHVIQPTKPRSGRADDVVRHVHRVAPEDRTVRGGHPVTTLERTVVDCSTSLPAADALVIADAALRAGADGERCAAILADMRGRRGSRVARAILAVADGGAESPGETAARLVVLRAGLPVPQTQVRVVTRLGTYWADLGWPEWRLVAEYDGRRKYGAAGDAVEAVIREKRRQEAIEETGWRVVRLTKEDLRRPGEVVRRLARFAPAGEAERWRPRMDLL